ncbi:MAG: Rrf2 family transcriptional regulator [Geminicoccaceae bacterium]
MLSHKAKYALRALLMLARQQDDSLLQVAEIAEQENVPRKFLEAILGELAKDGVLASQRGKGGGYRLARPADTVTLGQIVRLIDGPLAPVPCASVTRYRRCDDCPDERTCAIRPVMRRVRDAIADVLDRTTLSDVIEGGAASALVA